MKENFFVKNKSIMTFLILEVVALTAFNFGNISYIFALAEIALSLLGVVFLLNIEKDKKNLVKVLIPIGILFIISIFGLRVSLFRFKDVEQQYKSQTLITALSYFALPGFFLLGFFIRKTDDIKPKTVLFVLGAAFAAITLFGLISTLVQYGLFYSAIYKNTPFYYYDGIPYDATKEMSWLVGFEFNEVFIEYGSLFALLCSFFLTGLLFLSPKKEKNDFVICASIGGLGLLTLLVIPNFKAIIVLVLVSSIAFVYKFLRKNKKVLKILEIFAISVVGVGILFFLLTIINSATGFKFTGILERIFVGNRVMQNGSTALSALFIKDGNGRLINFFGIVPLSDYVGYITLETKIFEIEVLKEIGLIPGFLFLGFLGYAGFYVYKYLKSAKDNDFIRIIVSVLFVGFLVYETFFNVISSTIHTTEHMPFLRSSTTFVILFILGFVFMAPKKEEEKNE